MLSPREWTARAATGDVTVSDRAEDATWPQRCRQAPYFAIVAAAGHGRFRACPGSSLYAGDNYYDRYFTPRESGEVELRACHRQNTVNE